MKTYALVIAMAAVLVVGDAGAARTALPAQPAVAVPAEVQAAAAPAPELESRMNANTFATAETAPAGAPQPSAAPPPARLAPSASQPAGQVGCRPPLLCPAP